MKPIDRSALAFDYLGLFNVIYVPYLLALINNRLPSKTQLTLWDIVEEIYEAHQAT